MNFLKQIIYVGLGGFFGSATRYACTIFLSTLSNKYLYPFGTLMVNVLGSFFIGFLSVIFTEKSTYLKLFFTVGFLGGFTTFSSFSNETLNMFQNGYPINAFINIFANILLCLVCVYLGHLLAKNFF